MVGPSQTEQAALDPVNVHVGSMLYPSSKI